MRLGIPQTARRLILQSPASRQLFQKSMSHRMFNNRIDSILRKIINVLPQNNIAYLILGLNTFCFGAYLLWPQTGMHGYTGNFTFHKYSLKQGYYLSPFTCHFAHDNILAYAINSYIIYHLSSHLILPISF